MTLSRYFKEQQVRFKKKCKRKWKKEYLLFSLEIMIKTAFKKIIMSIFRRVLLTPGDTSIYSE